MMNNYPDNIHCYDGCPSSPFFEEPVCDECGSVEEDCVCNYIAVILSKYCEPELPESKKWKEDRKQK